MRAELGEPLRDGCITRMAPVWVQLRHFDEDVEKILAEGPTLVFDRLNVYAAVVDLLFLTAESNRPKPYRSARRGQHRQE